MKNWLKILGIIALAAVIGFAFIACPGEEEDENQVPEAGDYTIGKLSQETQKVVAVTIVAKEGKSPGAVVNIQYAGVSPTVYAKSATIPQAVGKYAVTFDVEEAEGWDAAEGLSAGTLEVILPPLPGTIAIAPTADIVLGANNTPLTATYTTTGTEQVTYQWNKNGKAISTATSGTYEVVADAIAQYTVTVSSPNYSSKTSNAVLVVFPASTAPTTANLFAGGSWIASVGTPTVTGAELNGTNHEYTDDTEHFTVVFEKPINVSAYTKITFTTDQGQWWTGGLIFSYYKFGYVDDSEEMIFYAKFANWNVESYTATSVTFTFADFAEQNAPDPDEDTVTFDKTNFMGWRLQLAPQSTPVNISAITLE